MSIKNNLLFNLYIHLSTDLNKNIATIATELDAKTIHEVRINIKRLNAYYLFLKHLDKEFKYKKDIKSIISLFQTAGEIRELQIGKKLISQLQTIDSMGYTEIVKILSKKELQGIKQFSLLTAPERLKEYELPTNKKTQNLFKNLTDEKTRIKINEYNDKLIKNFIKKSKRTHNKGKKLHKVRKIIKNICYINDFKVCQEDKLKAGLEKYLRDMEQLIGKWHDIKKTRIHLKDIYLQDIEGEKLMKRLNKQLKEC